MLTIFDSEKLRRTDWKKFINWIFGRDLSTIGTGNGDMVLADAQSVTGLKTFDRLKLAIKGTSTGTTVLDSANTGASDYTATLPAKNITVAGLDDLVDKKTIVKNQSFSEALVFDKDEKYFNPYNQNGVLTFTLASNTSGQGSTIFMRIKSDGNNINFPSGWVIISNEYLNDIYNYDIVIIYDGYNYLVYIIRINDPLSEYTNTKSLSITTTNNHVIIPDSSDFKFSDGANDIAFTISTWIRLNSLTNTLNTIIDIESGSEYRLRIFTTYPDSAVAVTLIDPSGNYILIKSQTNILNINTWYHLTISYDGSKSGNGVSIYLNGSLQTTNIQNSGTYSHMNISDMFVYIGIYNNSLLSNMLIDNYAIYKGICANQSQVTELYNSGLPVNHNLTSIFTYLKCWLDFNDNLNDLSKSNNGNSVSPVYSSTIKT